MTHAMRVLVFGALHVAGLGAFAAVAYGFERPGITAFELRETLFRAVAPAHP